MSKCEYLRKRCKKGCDKYVCRAYFPEKQPIIMDRDIPMCQGGGEDCVLRIEGRIYQKEKREKKHKIHCPFASNTICGKPWEWWCKGRVPPFPLTLYEEDAMGLPKKDEKGEIIFQRGIEEFKETCLSGNPEIYEECPWHKMGIEHRETWRRVKGFKEKE